MISPPTISCASFGPDWKREPIADPKYELISSFEFFFCFCALSLESESKSAQVVLRSMSGERRGGV